MPDHPAAKLCRPGTVPAGPVRVDQVQPEPVPDGPGPDRHREGPAPASISSRNEKARVNGLRRPPWLFFCPLPAPISTAAAPIGTGKDRTAHGDGLPDLPGLGGDGLPDHLPGLLLPAGPRRRPDDPAALLPAPLPDLPTTPAASPPAPRRRPNARGVRFST